MSEKKPMTILNNAADIDNKKLNEFVSKGGKSVKNKDNGFTKIVIRFPNELLHKIDEDINKKIGKMTRTYWIIEKLERYLINE